ncbi:MAG: phosphoribosylaminoimidazolesuccinocarboxamide synthase [Candidatus Heimdallarchaeota archaeon]|nr:phosphoribosylaminoimidazolesuccinocarboxamide synthase [Candidatus Heimdallarchaeota archaeon]
MNNQLYVGKAKTILATEDQNQVIVKFDDRITAGDGAKKADIGGKGFTNCRISVILFKILEKYQINTHLIEDIGDIMLKCHKLEILPIEVICRNISAGSFCRRYGVEEGRLFDEPLIEFFLKNDELHDPLLSEGSIISLKMATKIQLEILAAIALRVNTVLQNIFRQLNLELVDFKLEFGYNQNGSLLLGDEISPDSMRLWQLNQDGEKIIFDKDIFRKDLGDVLSGYNEVLQRLNNLEQPIIEVKPYSFKIDVFLKDGVIDAQGEVIKRAIQRLGFNNFEEIKTGKSFKINIDTINSEILMTLEKLAEELLANPLIETWNISLV